MNFLAEKLQARLKETGMQSFLLSMPHVFPKVLFLLISADNVTICKAAQSLGLMHKLVHTTDRLPFTARSHALFEPFRSKDRQKVPALNHDPGPHIMTLPARAPAQVIRKVIHSKLNLCHYLDVSKTCSHTLTTSLLQFELALMVLVLFLCSCSCD